MKIEINGKQWDFEVYGTIGLAYKAEQTLGVKELDFKDPHHELVLWYVAFWQSNKHKGDDVPDLEDFICSMTTERLNELGKYFWGKWAELEPGAGKEDGKTGEG